MTKKTDEQIIEILHLPKMEDSLSDESKEAHKLLTQEMIKAFRLGYKYGLLNNASNKLEECLD